MVDDSTAIETLEYAQCSIGNTITWPYPLTVPEDNVWDCVLALPETTSTTDGAAPFDDSNGLVIKGYYITAYIMDDGSGLMEKFSFSSATELFFSAGSGATSVTTYAATVIAAIAAFLY